MDYSPKTSFIPKQGAASVPQRKQRRVINVLVFLAVVVFLATLALAVGVFFYHNYSEEQLALRKKELEEKRASFVLGDIESIQRFERRLDAAQSLLDGHISMTKLFDIIGDRTQTNTQLTSFKYTRQPSGSAQVTLKGSSDSFNTIALQGQEFRTTKAFVEKSLRLSNISIENEEETNESAITFEVGAELSLDQVAYVPAISTTTSVVSLDDMIASTSAPLPTAASTTASTSAPTRPLPSIPAPVTP
ncbi:hypothetical protein K2X96_03720 [Patescibacteria group bacterium]|nr:hypothetical protein [Patescibacteria group bacterium]